MVLLPEYYQNLAIFKAFLSKLSNIGLFQEIWTQVIKKKHYLSFSTYL